MICRTTEAPYRRHAAVTGINRLMEEGKVQANMHSTEIRLKRVSNLLILASLTACTAALPFNVKLSMLPLAVAFGWSQIGGF
jgi:hypothetical protein